MVIPFLIAALGTPPPTLAVDSLIIGQYESKRWTEAGFDVPTWTNVPFREVLIGKMGKTVKVAKCVKMELTESVHVQGPNSQSAQGVLWSGPAPAFPRKVTVSEKLSSTERKALNDFLAPKGLGKVKFNVKNIVRGDFDGDRKADSVIECLSAKGDYSLVLSAQGGKKPTALWWETKDSEGHLSSAVIVAMADLDRNGSMELVLSGRYIEGGSGVVWSYQKSGPVKLVEHGA